MRPCASDANRVHTGPAPADDEGGYPGYVHVLARTRAGGTGSRTVDTSAAGFVARRRPATPKRESHRSRRARIRRLYNRGAQRTTMDPLSGQRSTDTIVDKQHDGPAPI